MPSNGIIYGACGDPDQLTYATRSALSAKQVMSDVPRHLWTSIDGPYDAVFDKVVKCPVSPEFLPRMLAALETPFDRTLVIDNDTRFVSSCASVFDLLDQFDIAAAHAPLRQFGTPTYPEGFAAFNCGVILFKRTPEVLKFFKDWIDQYQQQRLSSSVVAVDQLLFAEAVYRSNLRICTLPPEYNLRSIFSMFIGGRTSVKIVHGKEPELSLWADRFKRLGWTESPQVFQLKSQEMVGCPGQGPRR